MSKKRGEIIYPLAFFIGLGLMYWQIIIYRNTLVDIKLLISIILLVSVIAFILDFKNYKKTYTNYKGVYLYFFGIGQYIVSYGFIVCSLFLIINYYFKDDKSEIRNYRIIERSSLPGRKYHRKERKPTFYIYIKGTKKELIFTNLYYDKMNEYKSVELIISKGYFGFDILENKKLK